MIATVLAEGQHQRVTAAWMNLACGQQRHTRGVSPGALPQATVSGGLRPNRFSVQTGLPGRALLAVEVLIHIVRASCTPVCAVHLWVAGTRPHWDRSII